MLVPIVLHPGLAPGQAEVIVDPGTPIIAISGSGPVDSTGYLQVVHALGRC